MREMKMSEGATPSQERCGCREGRGGFASAIGLASLNFFSHALKRADWSGHGGQMGKSSKCGLGINLPSSPRRVKLHPK